MGWPFKRVAAGVVVLVLAALYFSGSLDTVLFKVHLNFGTCGENGFGAVFCGSDLTAYNARINAAERAAQQTLRSLTTTTSSSSAATSSAATSSAAVVAASTSGTIKFALLPNSSEQEATVTVSHYCGSESSCFWFGEAAQYPPKTKCPAVFDPTASIWTSSAQQVGGTVTQSFAFQPLAGGGEVCVYAHDPISGDQLAN